jgi:hypothetical protein
MRKALKTKRAFAEHLKEIDEDSYYAYPHCTPVKLQNLIQKAEPNVNEKVRFWH